MLKITYPDGFTLVIEDELIASNLTSGTAHVKYPTASKVRIVADPEKLASIKELVEKLLPAWRLEQGLREIASEGVEVTTSDTSAYLKWVMGDVLKEEADTIAVSGFEWKKDLAPQMTQAARQFFFTHLNNMVGLN